jgi:hypothetical protein
MWMDDNAYLLLLSNLEIIFIGKPISSISGEYRSQIPYFTERRKRMNFHSTDITSESCIMDQPIGIQEKLSMPNSSLPSTSYSETATIVDTPPKMQLGEVNEIGHIQELERNFSLLSICAVGLVTGSTWAALGGSIAVSI